MINKNRQATSSPRQALSGAKTHRFLWTPLPPFFARKAGLHTRATASELRGLRCKPAMDLAFGFGETPRPRFEAWLEFRVREFVVVSSRSRR